jgi:hypothetical protein
MNAENDTARTGTSPTETSRTDTSHTAASGSASRPSGDRSKTTPPDGAVGQPAEPGFTQPAADRPPTEDEAALAERLADDVDLDRVAEHYEEAMETGANVRGEGAIEAG